MRLSKFGDSTHRGIPISWIIGLCSAGMLLPLIVLGIFGLNRWAEKQREDEIVAIRSHAAALASALDRELKGYIDTAEVLAGSRHLQSFEISVMDELARDAAQKTGGNFVLLDSNLRQLINTRSKPGEPLPITQNTRDATAALQNNGPKVADIVTGTYSGLPQFVIHVPVQVDNKTRYILAYSPNRTAIAAVLNETLRPAGWLAAVIDGSGIIVARSVRNEDFAGTSASTAFLQNITQQPSGVVESSDREGRASVTAFESSKLSNWRAVVWAPKDVLAGPQKRALNLIVLAATTALILSFISAWLLGRLIANMTRSLTAASTAVGSGRSVEIEPSLIREANTIGSALSYASSLIEKRELELSESEERLRLALEGAHAGAWELELPTDRMIYTSEFGALCGLGSSAGAMPSRVWLDQCVHASDRRLLKHAVLAALSGKTDRLQQEFRIVVAELGTRWLLAMGQIQRGTAGAVRLRGIAIDITSRKAADAATARLATIVDSSSDAIISKTPEGIVTSWNSAAERLFGYAREEMLGHSIRRLIPPDRQFEEDTILSRISAGERVEPFDTMRLHKSGRLIDVSASISPIFDGDGRVIGASKIARDITDRKAAAEKLEILLREVNHRSKNMLSITQSIARQTAATGADDFVERFLNRLQALAANQDLLVKNEWSGAGLGELAHMQLAMFKDLIGSRITIRGPELELMAGASQAIGMALHELATNAGKYGALSNEAGHLDLEWTIDAGKLDLSWTERDGPPLSPPSRKGFGTTVLKQLVERGVGGTVTLDFAPSGLHWRLVCPLSSIATPRSTPGAGMRENFVLQSKP